VTHENFTAEFGTASPEATTFVNRPDGDQRKIVPQVEVESDHALFICEPNEMTPIPESAVLMPTTSNAT
jgi:hypothetical protein